MLGPSLRMQKKIRVPPPPLGNAHSRHSLHSSHTQSMNVEKHPDQPIFPLDKQHGRLQAAFEHMR